MNNGKMITLTVNGRSEDIQVPAHRTLLEALRDLGHIEVKRGCEKGDCGACAVLVDDIAIDSCLTLAWTCEDVKITTVSGLGNAENPHPLQSAFVDLGAVQCGFCSPGMIVAAVGLLNEKPDPTEDDIRLALSGNLCRCTGYTKIFDAVKHAALVMSAEGAKP
ncbi:MAG: (2Fe-2S)-binding protein [Hyphomicrobiales bacterium]|nr:(2Fe-2S)-binding protein [Hyphomicrobiales bacterium]MCP4999052.1 (2Fe-2S)-binding protein [Hyphomicrobiales bacterium]